MVNSEIIDRRTALARKVWLGLSGTWVLGTAGGAVLLLFLCARFVQQMPSRLRDDPVEAERWQRVASEQYGLLGNGLRALGLFHVLQNPLLQLLLMIIALVLLIQLGNVIAATWRLYRIKRWLQSPVRHPGDPVPVAATQPLYRLREALPGEIEPVAAAIDSVLAQRFPATLRADLTILAPSTVTPSTVTLSTVTPSTGEVQPPALADTLALAPSDAPRPEIRLLAFRYLRYALLRPILLIGLGVALIVVWLNLGAGWEITPPLLAPGDQYHSTAQNLTINYDITSLEAANTPPLQVQVGAAHQQLTLNSTLRANWWQLAITNQSGPPALLIQTEDAAPLLSQLGQTQALPQIGLIFPSVGSEESIVVDQALGLRVVRLLGTSEQPGITAFWVEVYQVGADEPVLRLEIADRSTQVLTVNEKSYTLQFVPLPSVMLNVRYQPGVWLLGPALLLVLIGSVGYWQRPAFVLAQVAPWPGDRAVLVFQSDLALEIQALRDWLTQQRAINHETS